MTPSNTLRLTLCPGLLLALPLLAQAQLVPVLDQAQVRPVVVAPGVEARELTGRAAAAKSTQGSVALFHLAPGRASAWSHNKAGEESFFVLKGHGEVWTGNVAQAVGPGAFILVPPAVVRSIRASKGEALEFYAVTTPAWSRDDDVLVAAPDGAPQ